MNKRFLSVTVLLVLVLGFAACQTTTRTQDRQEKAQTPTPESSVKREASNWPPLSPVVLSPYLVNTAQLAGVGAGDTLALPLASGFQTLTLTAPLKDGVLGIKELKLKLKDLQGGVINIVVKTLHTHDPKGDEASFVYDKLTAQPEGGLAMDLVGAFEAGKLVGYKYDVAALGALSPGTKIAIVDEEGWRVVKVKASLRDGVLAIEGFKVSSRSEPVANLRAFDATEGKAGLIWQSG
jgi:hypothetical protein